MGCAVVDTVPVLGIEVYVVVMHSCGGPLDVYHYCGGVGVLVQGVFVAPAGDVEGLVLAAIGEVH